jgi:uncharacterized protein (TIGR00297 family)
MQTIFIIGILLLSAMSCVFQLLTVKGSIAAFLIGSIIFFAFQWQGIVILGLFFVTSSLLTKWKKDQKHDKQADAPEDKKGRTAGQVFANGGMGFLTAGCQLLMPDPLWLIMFSAAFATCTADTWASEIGVLSKRKPFHLKEWKRVDRGLSGAISILGTVSAFVGACFIGISFYLIYHPTSLIIIWLIILAGFLGNLADTFFGAWFEQKFLCRVCKKETESKVHCHVQSVRVFGYPWVTNNLVNFSSTVVGAMIAGGFYLWIIR